MQIEELFCKVCGSAIGGMTSQVKGRRFESATKTWIEEHVLEFRRFHNYAELKMQFEDGSYHVTNGCRTCLSATLIPEQLHELHIADMEVEDMIYPGQEEHMARIPVSAVAIRIDGGGIL
jgi:hypothetical protein